MNRFWLVCLSVLSCVTYGSANAQSLEKQKGKDIALDTIVISATRMERLQQDVPVRTEVISAAELQKTHARSLKEALENVPGLQLREIHGKSGFEVILQGMNSDQVLVLIDGLPLAASTGSSVDLNQYALVDIERIEIIKGAASSQFGSSAMGGVINVITKPLASGLTGSVTYDVGSYGKQNIGGRASDIGQQHVKAKLQGGSETLQAGISVDLRDNQGFDANPDSWSRQGDESKRLDYAGRLAWQPNKQTFFIAEAQRFTEDDTQWLPPALVGLKPNKFESIERDRYSLAGGYRWHSGWNLSAKYLNENYLSDSYKQNIGFQAYDQRQMELGTDYVNLQLEAPLVGNHQFIVGADIRHETLLQFKDGVAEIGEQGDAERHNYELFVQDDYFFSERGEWVLGLRVQEDSDFGTYASPKIAFKYRLFDNGDNQVLFRTSVGTGYRVPNLKERYYTFDHSSIGYMVMGNPDLQPESSISYQANLWFKLGEQRTLDINAFYNDVRDLIQTDDKNADVINGISVYTYKNISSAKIVGLETLYTDQLFERISFNASHTYTNAKNGETNQALTRRPQHIARIGLDFDLSDRWQLITRARYQSKELASSGDYSLTNTPSTWSPSWVTLDIKTNYQLTPSTTVFAGVDNITNRQRDFSTGQDFGPIIGRFMYLGLEIKTQFF